MVYLSNLAAHRQEILSKYFYKVWAQIDEDLKS